MQPCLPRRSRPALAITPRNGPTCSRSNAAAAAVTLAALALVGVSRAVADDTEVFFADEPGAGGTGPNVLFVLPAGRAMGCAIGSIERCELAIEDGTARIDVVKAALARVIGTLVDSGTNVGLMRGNDNGLSGAAGARGGFVAQEVAPVTKARGDELLSWICPPGMDRRDCRHVLTAGGDAPSGQLMLDPSNDGGFCPPGDDGAPACHERLGEGRSALTEILFEANRYFAGRRPAWGMHSIIGPGHPYPGHGYAPASIWGPATAVPADCRDAGVACRYRSPARDCQRNVLVILSDGLLGEDRGNDTGAVSIPGSAGDPPPYDRWFRAYHDPRGLTAGLGRHGCSVNTGIDYRRADPVTGEEIAVALSDCGDDLAYSMRSGGFVAGRRSAQVLTHTVAFDLASATRAEGIAAEAPRRLLQMLARAGGGKHVSLDCVDCTPADATDELAALLIDIVRESQVAGAAVGAATVPVNSFNRTEHHDDVYLSVFQPAASQRWKGNVKKYRLAPNGDILGRHDVLAVNALTGRLEPRVGSLWPVDAAIADGDDVLAGGAAAALPDPPDRLIYTNEGGARAHALSSYPVERVAGRADAAIALGYRSARIEPPACPDHPGAAPADAGNPAVCHLLAWIRGADVADAVPVATEDTPAGNGNVTEPRHDLGDPLHTRAAVVTYGGDADEPRAVVYSLTNDGALHAFDPETGRERWAFIPWDRLDRMLALYRDRATRPRTSLGLDGQIRVLTLDRNGNGQVEPAADGSGDRVILYFGMRRGGRNTYAVDVTGVDFADPSGDRPTLLWIAGPADDATIDAERRLPLVGQSWSRPVVTRLKVPGHRGLDDLVVMLAGGYDPASQDPVDGMPQPYVDDAVGTGLYALDALTGRLLWRAGPDAGADLRLAGLTAAIPGDLKVLDLSGDGRADAVYFADLRGRLWRVDFDPAAAGVASLASGGILAELGGDGLEGARRFFTSPDVSSVIEGGRRWLNVAIGSGNRELPLTDRTTRDRFYSLRDYAGARRRDWSRTVPVTEADLIDVTPDAAAGGIQAAVPAGAAGWLIRLETRPGEKAISSSRTFDHTVFFPTFAPTVRAAEGACDDAVGQNLLYQVSVLDARPGRHLAETAHEVEAGGLALRLGQGGIAPEPVIVFPPSDGSRPGEPPRSPPLCLVGIEGCGSLGESGPRRTFWRQRGAE